MRGLAQNLLNDGQTDAALEQYKIILDADPHDPQSYLRVAEIYRRTGKFDQAMDALKKAQTYVQDSLELPYNMALIYQAQGRHDFAIDDFTSAIGLNPSAPEAYYARGLSYLERNDARAAVDRMTRIALAAATDDR